nr:ribonuclease H-like domain-containing protein [Tanacetum cinerariifolium]
MHKAFPLPVIEFPLPGEVPTASEESSHCHKKRDATAHKIVLLLKSRRNCQSKSDDSYAKLVPHVTPCILGITVIDFGDSYEVPTSAATSGTASDGTGKKKGRTITLTAEDMQKRKNDVKVRTTLLLSLPDEYQLQFSKYKTAQELWAAILKTFGGNEATKKTKKNLLKQQYAKHSRGNEDVNTASVSTASTNVPTASANIRMDIKWNMALLSMRADKFWKKTGKKISIQGTDVAGFDKSKVECFNCHKMGHFARKCRAPRSQDRGRRDNYRQRSKVEEQAPKALMAIDGNMIYHYKLALAQVESRLAEHKDRELEYCKKIRVLEVKTESSTDCIKNLKNELKLIKKDKEGLDTKLTGFQTASKDLDSLLESQRLDKNKEGFGYSDVPLPPAQIYFPPKKDMSWKGLSECADNTITDYSRPSPAIESTSGDAQNRNPSVTKTEASPSTISPKPFLNFVKANDSPTKSKTDKVETAKKLPVKKIPTANKKFPTGSTKFSTADMGKKENAVKASAHMTGNISYLSDYEPFDGGYVSFGQGGCKITGKGTIKTGKLEFENVYFLKDLKYNLFSISQICDNKNSVLFTDSECIVLGQNFKLSDDDNMLLRTPRQHNMYSIDLNNIVPH